MTIEKRYRERYKSGNTPWDVGQPDFNLIEIVTKNRNWVEEVLKYRL